MVTELTKPIQVIFMNIKTKIVTSEKGAALIVSLIVIIVVTLFAAIAVTMNAIEVKVSDNHKEADKALYEADSGIQQAIAQLKTTTAIWTNSNSSFTSLLTGATLSNPWINFLSSGNYVVKIKDDDDESAPSNPSVDANRSIYINSEGSTLFGSKKIIQALVQADLPEDISVWNNALFVGSGLAGKMINGNVTIAGSVHLLGENSDGVQTIGNADQVVDLDILTLGGNAMIANNYQGLDSTVLGKIPDITNSPKSLDSFLRVKHGQVDLGGNAKIGAPETTSVDKDKMNGVYVTDGFNDPSDLNNVFTDATGVYNDTIPPAYQSLLKMPSLSNEISPGVSYETWLSTNSVHIPTITIDFANGAATTLSANKDSIETSYPGTTVTADTGTGNFTVTRTDPNGNQHSISWVKNTKTLTVKGVVTVEGDITIGTGSNDTVTYITNNTSINGTSTVGSTIFAKSNLTGGTGKIILHNDILPSGSNSFATPTGETLGFVAKD